MRRQAPGGPGVPTAPPKLHLAPTTDLAQAAAIAWLIDVQPRALAAHAELLPALDTVFPHERVAAFTERNGFDPLALEELTLASYASAEGETTLYLLRGALDPAKLESIFRAQTGGVEGRAIDRRGGGAGDRAERGERCAASRRRWRRSGTRRPGSRWAASVRFASRSCSPAGAIEAGVAGVEVGRRSRAAAEARS